MSTHRPVLVMEMLVQLNNSAESRTFMQDLQPLLDAPRPRIVFDCSEVRQVDRAGVAMILHCLEEAMKRDGDLKLAALRVQSEAALELKAFGIFATSDEAVRSFNSVPAMRTLQNAFPNDYADGGELKKAS
jgi:anti-sigma B factor antagonist